MFRFSVMKTPTGFIDARNCDAFSVKINLLTENIVLFFSPKRVSLSPYCHQFRWMTIVFFFLSFISVTLPRFVCLPPHSPQSKIYHHCLIVLHYFSFSLCSHCRCHQTMDYRQSFVTCVEHSWIRVSSSVIKHSDHNKSYRISSNLQINWPAVLR